MPLFGPPNIEKMKDKGNIKGLIKAMSYKKDAKVRQQAVLALAQIGGSESMAAIVSALDDPEWKVRCDAARSLGKFGSVAIEPLTKPHGDEHPRVQDAAGQAVRQICESATPDTLRELMKNGHDWIRLIAVRSLRKTAGDSPVNWLIEALSDRSGMVRDAAVAELILIGEPAIDPLLYLLKSDNPNLSTISADALEKMGWEPTDDEIGAWYFLAKREYKQLIALGEPSVGPLIEALKDKDNFWRQRKAKTLGQIGDRRAVEPLIDALKDNYKGVREEAAIALGKIGDPRAVEPLVSALRDEERNIRKAAVCALAEIGDPRVIVPLIEALHVYLLRDKILEILQSFGDLAVDPLIAALNHENSNVRNGAAQALGLIGDDRAVEPLIAALKDQRLHVSRNAAEALKSFRDQRFVEPLIVALQTNSPSVRQVAAETLGILGDDRAVDPLIAALKDPDWIVSEIAANSLRRIGDDRVVEPLIDMLGDEDKRKRSAAAHNLGFTNNARVVEPLIEALNDKERDVRQEAAIALVRLVRSERLDVKVNLEILSHAKKISKMKRKSHTDHADESWGGCFGDAHHSDSTARDPGFHADFSRDPVL